MSYGVSSALTIVQVIGGFIELSSVHGAGKKCSFQRHLGWPYLTATRGNSELSSSCFFQISEFILQTREWNSKTKKIGGLLFNSLILIFYLISLSKYFTWFPNKMLSCYLSLNSHLAVCIGQFQLRMKENERSLAHSYIPSGSAKSSSCVRIDNLN